MTTRLQYEQDIVEILAQRDEALKGLPTPLTTTSASGDALGVITTQLGRGTGNANRFDGRAVKIITGTLVGEVAGIDDGGFDATSDLTTSPAFSGNPASGVDFLLYPKGFGPEVVVQGINRVLRNTESLIGTPATLVPDGDMEDSDMTRWTDVGSPTTSQKETDSGVFSLFGERQGIEVVADAVSEGVISDPFDVEEAKDVYVAALIDAATTGVTFSIRGVTSASDYKTATITSGKVVLVLFRTIVADGDSSAFLRAVSVASSGTFRIGFCWAWDRSLRYEMSTISSLWDAYMPIVDVHQLIPDQTALDTDTYVLGQVRRRPFVGWNKDSYPEAVRQTVLELHQPSIYPLLVKAKRPFIELSADTSTSSADREYVKFKVVANLLRDRGENEWRGYARAAAQRAQALGYGGKEVSIVENLIYT